MMQHAWVNIMKFASSGESLNVSSRSLHYFYTYLPLAIVGSVDNLHLMGMGPEYAQAVGWIRDHLVLDKARGANDRCGARSRPV